MTGSGVVGLLTLCVALLTGLPASAATIDTRVLAYCHTDHCGYASDADMETLLRANFAELNIMWSPTGISFRAMPTADFLTVIQEDPAHYSAIKDDKDPLLHLLSEEAKAARGVLTIIAIEDLGFNFSSVLPGASDIPYGFYTRPFEDGETWAHELGHHFCLAHTFTMNDPEAPAFTPVEHDNDAAFGGGDLGPAVADTPPDPGELECASPTRPDAPDDAGPTCTTQGSSDPPSDYIPGHEWCEWEVEGTTESPSTDPGSYRPTYCTGLCFHAAGDHFLESDFQPLPNVAMSYSFKCMGPYVVDGQSYPAFTPGQGVRIRWCYENVVERNYVDVCDDRGGDSDRDGICDDDDDCPSVADNDQGDRDGDGIGDLCDLCPDLAELTGDTDGDGAGDACDPDDDDDGCLDANDQHPLEANVVVGQSIEPQCNPSSAAVRAFEGDDPDHDGIASCADDDDDNDGLEDGEDPCPQKAGPSSSCISTGNGCGLLRDPIFDACSTGACNEFFLQAVFSNPDPTRGSVFDRLGIVNQKLYLFASAGHTLTETAKSLVDLALVPRSNGAGSAAAGGLLQLEIWSRRPKERVGIVAQYDAHAVRFGDLIHGALLAVVPGDGGLAVDAVWGVGAAPGGRYADADRDGVPDAFDNCKTTSNDHQADSDRDQVGDACDPDFDNDGVVHRGDVDLVKDCKGADLRLSESILEPGVGKVPVAGGANARLLQRCRHADIDGNGFVDGNDLQIAGGYLGFPPGPSGKFGGGPVALCEDSRDCDDGNDCTDDECKGSTCIHRYNTSPCDDGAACSETSICSKGACVPQLIPACDDDNSCTVDRCAPTGRCLHTPTLACIAAFACIGDCDLDGAVAADELSALVTLDLRGASPDTCASGDIDRNGRVTAEEVIRAVLKKVHSCISGAA